MTRHSRRGGSGRIGVVYLHTSGWDDALRRRLRLRTASIASMQQGAQAEPAVRFSTASAGRGNCSILLASMRSLRRSTRERLTLGCLVRILLPLVDLLLELLCLFLIRKAQASQTVLQLERVEERPVLVVLERVVDFLIPEDATVGGRDVHELDEVGVTHKIIGEDRSALESSVDPSAPFGGVGDVEFGNRNSVDLVGSLGNSALDSLLVVV